MNSRISAFQTISDICTTSGGTARVVVDLADALGDISSVDPIIMCQARIGGISLPSGSARVERRIATVGSSLALRSGIPFRSALRKSISVRKKNSVIHNHGVWSPVNHWASSIGRGFDVPVIVQPHGMLEPWSLGQKYWKKRVALSLFQRFDIESAKALIATSVEEYENLRNLGFNLPIAVIPNGVKDRFQNFDLDSDLIVRSSTQACRSVLFLSRIHPKKGLLNLIHAWSNIPTEGWILNIAGPDEGGHLAEVMRLARELGVEDSVKYVGLVDGQSKADLYRRSDIFVLPTFSENFGVVVAEALAFGVPVVTTKGAPWSDLPLHKCGWWIDIGVPPLMSALQEAMRLSDFERNAMGARGREYVQRFNWDDIAQQTANVYLWALGQTLPPPCLKII